jgi:hypothetical protein
MSQSSVALSNAGHFTKPRAVGVNKLAGMKGEAAFQSLKYNEALAIAIWLVNFGSPMTMVMPETAIIHSMS